MSRRANELAIVLALALLAGVAGCPRRNGDAPSSTGADGGGVKSPGAVAAVAAEGDTDDNPPAAEAEAQAEAEGDDPAVAPSPEEALVAEDREKDPRSEKVTVTVVVDPIAGTRVAWGAKNFGAPPLKLERPRNSGPLDLVITSPGYLVAHTRVFTDRDDSVTVHMVAERDAPRMRGYRSQAGVPKPPVPAAPKRR